MVCYSERIQIKASQRKRCIEQSSELGVSLSSPRGVMDSVTFMVMMCDNLHGMLPTREAQLSFGIQEFSRGSVVDCLSSRSLISSPSKEELTPLVSTPFWRYSSHCVAKDKQKHNDQAGFPRAWRLSPSSQEQLSDLYLGTISSVLYTLILKSVSLSLFSVGWDLLTHAWFFSIMNWSFGKYWLIEFMHIIQMLIHF